VPDVVAFLFFLALAAFATRPLAARMGSHTLAGGDPLVDLWTLDWLAENALRPGSLFHGNTFHPAPHAVLYSDLTLGTAVLLVPFRWLGLDPVPLYNVAVLLSLAFAGWAWHRLGLEWSGRRDAALACGVIAAFGSHQLYHVYHVNLLATGWLALLLLALGRLRAGPRPGPVLLAGVSYALAAQTSGYYAVIGALLAVVFALVHVRELARPRLLAGYAGGAVLAAVLLLPFLHASLEVRSGQSFRRPAGMSASQSFQPSRDLGSRAYVYQWLLAPGQGERLFPGLLAVVLAGAAVRRRGRETRFLWIAVAVLLVLSLGPWLEVAGTRVPLPYGALHALPLFESMRHPYTFAAVAVMLLGVLAAAGWASLPPRVGFALLAVAVLEVAGPGPDLQPLPGGLPGHYAVLDRLPPGPVLEIPPFGEESLLWAARTGRPMLNGQGSAFVPLDTLRLNRYVQNHWIKRTPTDVDTSKPGVFLVQRFPVRYLVLPAARLRQLGPLAEALRSSRVFALVGEGEDGSLVYEVRREHAPAAAPVSDEGEDDGA
jgi:hypothetical protein